MRSSDRVRVPAILGKPAGEKIAAYRSPALPHSETHGFYHDARDRFIVRAAAPRTHCPHNEMAGVHDKAAGQRCQPWIAPLVESAVAFFQIRAKGQCVAAHY